MATWPTFQLTLETTAEAVPNKQTKALQMINQYLSKLNKLKLTKQ